MSNIQDFSNKIQRYLIARIPFISIKSIERNRVLDAFSNVNNELHLPIYVHTLSKGMIDLSSNNFLTAAHYISEPKMAVMKGNGKMSKKTSNNMICAATAMVAGGIAFAATKAMTSNKTQNVKKATGKAIKAVGAVIESLQM